MFLAGSRICKGQVKKKMMALWRNKRYVYLGSEWSRWLGRLSEDRGRQKTSLEVKTGGVKRYGGMWFWIGCGSQGKYLRFHYSEGNGKLRWFSRGVMTWNFHFRKNTVGTAWLWSIWEVRVVWTKGVQRSRQNSMFSGKPLSCLPTFSSTWRSRCLPLWSLLLS